MSLENRLVVGGGSEAEVCLFGLGDMDLSKLVTSNNYTTERSIRGRTSSNPDKMQPRVMLCDVIPSISIPKNAYQDNSPSRYNNLRIHQPPLSPPEEGQIKCTLPSISSLLQGVDSISQGSEASKDYQDNSLNETQEL